MKQKILQAFDESAAVKRDFIEQYADMVVEVAELIAQTFGAGGRLFLFGNGGSATDASHIAAEMVGRFKKERPGLPAIALNTDMAIISSIANDYDYSEVFARQLKALAAQGDVAIAISTSGGSPNVMKAIEAARKKGVKVIALTGMKGKKFASKSDYAFLVPSEVTARIQETHITLGHVICQMVEEILFEVPRKK
jgi:D-sedoheptulose 7-phosphate isomerase